MQVQAHLSNRIVSNGMDAPTHSGIAMCQSGAPPGHDAPLPAAVISLAQVGSSPLAWKNYVPQQPERPPRGGVTASAA